MRISDTVRYESDFVPSREPFSPDAHTKALFHFDGTVDGVGAENAPLKVRYSDK